MADSSRCTVVISNSRQSNWYSAHNYNQRKNPISLSSIDMNKTAENTKSATQKAVANPHQMKGVMAAVTAVVGEEPDTYDGVDEHPGSLDLPIKKPKITTLLADCRRLPKGSAERFKAFRKLLKVLHDEYAK